MDQNRLRQISLTALVVLVVAIGSGFVAALVFSDLRRGAIRDLWQYNVIYSRDGLTVSFEDIRTDVPFAEIVAKVNRLGGAPSMFIVNCRVSEHDAMLLARVANVRSLDITRSSVSKGGLAPFREMSTLRHLEVGPCKLTDDALMEIADIRQVESLVLWEDGITDSAVAKLKRLAADLTVDVRRSPDYHDAKATN